MKSMDPKAPGFYGSYASFKHYSTPRLGSKQIRRLDRMLWEPAQCRADMRYFEIGCGTGAVLAYLVAKGCTDVVGIDHDPALADVVPAFVRGRFACRDVWDALADPAIGMLDRVIALDVLEHFSPEDVLRLLRRIDERLAPGGRIIIKVPNTASPWGLQYQFGDLTHRTAFAPISIRQLADAAGLGGAVILPHREGSRRRRITDRIVQGVLSWALLTPPEIWTANMVAVLFKRQD